MDSNKNDIILITIILLIVKNIIYLTFLFPCLPCRKTKNPSKMGSAICPERLARWCAPSPKAPASNVANALFKPLPRVAPEKYVKHGQIIRIIE
jgi:hypothetical protein